MVLYLYQNKISKLSINANILVHTKNELKYLHILNLIVFMPYLSYI